MTDPLHVCVVTGEESGDALAASIVAALRRAVATERELHLTGVGGARLEALGLRSLFPLEDIAVMGITAVLARLPLIMRRIAQTADHVVAARPDLLLLVDSPDFTHRVAKGVRARAPGIPAVKVVSPSVWAWRPGRARAMAAYVDHLLALLPFEPEVHERLGGPPTTYIGHPLIEAADLHSNGTLGDDAMVLLLPGSRGSEIARHMGLFGEVAKRIATHEPHARFVLPAVPHVRPAIEAAIEDWEVPVRLIGPDEKHGAMRRATAALAASGTVTLELALAGVPMVVAYRIDPIVARLRWLGTMDSIVLPNLILGRNAFPEFIHRDASADALTAALSPLLRPGAPRDAQLAAAAEVGVRMRGDNPVPPSEVAARAILDVLAAKAALRTSGARRFT